MSTNHGAKMFGWGGHEAQGIFDIISTSLEGFGLTSMIIRAMVSRIFSDFSTNSIGHSFGKLISFRVLFLF